MQSKITPEITGRLVAAIQQVNCTEADAALAAGIGERTLRRWKRFAERAEEALPEGWKESFSVEDLRAAAEALEIRVPGRMARRRLVAVLEIETEPYLDMLRRMRQAVVQGEFVLAQRLRERAMGGRTVYNEATGQMEFVPERVTRVKKIRVPGQDGRPAALVVVEETETIRGPSESAMRFILTRRYAERWRAPKSAETQS